MDGALRLTSCSLAANKMGVEKEARKVSEMIQVNPREWLMMPGIDPRIAELLKEVDDERALLIQLIR